MACTVGTCRGPPSPSPPPTPPTPSPTTPSPTPSPTPISPPAWTCGTTTGTSSDAPFDFTPIRAAGTFTGVDDQGNDIYFNMCTSAQGIDCSAQGFTSLMWQSGSFGCSMLANWDDTNPDCAPQWTAIPGGVNMTIGCGDQCRGENNGSHPNPKHAKNRSIHVSFICDHAASPGPDTFTVRESEECVYSLTFPTSMACVGKYFPTPSPTTPSPTTPSPTPSPTTPSPTTPSPSFSPTPMPTESCGKNMLFPNGTIELRFDLSPLAGRTFYGVQYGGARVAFELCTITQGFDCNAPNFKALAVSQDPNGGCTVLANWVPPTSSAPLREHPKWALSGGGAGVTMTVGNTPAPTGVCTGAAKNVTVAVEFVCDPNSTAPAYNFTVKVDPTLCTWSWIFPTKYACSEN